MSIAHVVVTLLAITANAAIAAADYARAEFVLANSAEVRVPRSWVPLLATLKAAGAAGLLLGLLGARSLGVAAAVGLVLFYAGALVFHVRARAFHNIAFPGGYFALAAGTLVLTV
ncbi:DoxX family protein [Streptomyces huiliensis]|uniref:DoxX family protein n=1 Tax=Streptomyces huiliensis TaxID=2876027 RepID=UPI001CBEA4CE|nr:DoxX family protein [Streptomyces huiliensis]MBZ4319149.1 DoxX family protein [Streptomyces huiliensis]